MAETIGDLIDKLTISNIRLWHIEDARREYCNNKNGHDKKAIDLLNKVSQVNKERNDLIDQINASLMVIFDKSRNKNSNLITSANEIFGYGKNKFYKIEDT